MVHFKTFIGTVDRMSLFASKTTEKKRNVYYDFVTVASCIQELNSEKIDEKLRQHFRKKIFEKKRTEIGFGLKISLKRRNSKTYFGRKSLFVEI